MDCKSRIMEYAWNMNDISFEYERNMNDISMEYEWKISLCLHLWQPSNNAKSKKPGHDEENIIELPSWTYILICLDSFWWLLLSVINRITIMITSLAPNNEAGGVFNKSGNGLVGCLKSKHNHFSNGTSLNQPFYIILC